jgi:putative membrane protein
MATRVLLTAWNFDPLAIAFLALLLAGYFAAVGPLRRRVGEEPVRGRRIASFVAGWALLALAVLSPLDAIGRQYLFVAHAAQLFIIITFVAPLLMLGVPEWLTSRLLAVEGIRRATRGLLFPLIAILAFNGLILIWHIPQFYEPSLHDMRLHNLQLFSILLAGLVDWWPLLTPLDRHTRLASPMQILYLGAESVPIDLFGFISIFARAPFYETYAAAPRIFGIPALLDQQLAGGIIAVPNNTIDFILMSVAFFGWVARMERAQNEREAAEHDAELAELEAYTLAREAELGQADVGH